MKKKISLIIIFLIGIIFIPKNVFALDFTVGDNTYTVSDIETLRDYVYFNYVKGNDISYLVCGNKSSYPSNTWLNCFTTNDTVYSNSGDYNSTIAYQQPFGENAFSGYNYYDNNISTFDDYGTQLYYYKDNNDYDIQSNVNFLNYDDNSVVNFGSNYTFNDIECKYHTSECESGGGSGGEEPEEPTPEEPTQITTNELYQLGVVGITVVCVLICMLFLKWCFPMKGGKKI